LIPSLADIEAARPYVEQAALRTPLLAFNGSASRAIYLKLENLQPIGSFKLRGAASKMLRLPDDALHRGVFTASAGNMAQGVAWCAQRKGIAATVIAPDTAPQTKIAAIERLGARLIRVSFDEWWKVFAERSYPGLDATFIHAFDDPDVMAGNGTIGVEIIEDLPRVASVLIPWGGGGLSCGIASAVRALQPQCRIYACEVATAAPLSAAWKAGAPRTIEYTPSFVDGIGSRTVFPAMFERARKLLDGVLVASLEQVADAVRLLLERNHTLAEGAGACALACALAHQADLPDGPVVCIVSGGNLDPSQLVRLLAPQ
jgi:threonine dehydratase